MDQDELQKFVKLVADMRRAQREVARTRGQVGTSVRVAIALETRVDLLVRQFAKAAPGDSRKTR